MDRSDDSEKSPSHTKLNDVDNITSPPVTLTTTSDQNCGTEHTETSVEISALTTQNNITVTSEVLESISSGAKKNDTSNQISGPSITVTPEKVVNRPRAIGKSRRPQFLHSNTEKISTESSEKKPVFKKSVSSRDLGRKLLQSRTAVIGNERSQIIQSSFVPISRNNTSNAIVVNREKTASKSLRKRHSSHLLKSSLGDLKQQPQPDQNTSDPKPGLPVSKISYEDLPEAVIKQCEKCKISTTAIKQNITIIDTISRFLMKEIYKDKEKETDNKPQNEDRKKPFATESQVAFAMGLIKKTEKPMKKIFKDATFAAKGGFGAVFYARESSGGKRNVAVKKLSHQKDKSIKNNYSELSFLASSKHNNILTFYDCYLVEENYQPSSSWWGGSSSSMTPSHSTGPGPEIWLVTEYLEGGTLSQAARLYKFNDQQISFITLEILKGVSYLHSRKLVHRDLKSSNIMLSIRGDVKIIDMGLCADFSDGPRTALLGSPYWIPPEMIVGKPHSFSADIWSLAVCILEVYMMVPPLSNSSFFCMYTVATEGLANQIPSNCNALATDFLKKCLVLDSTQRPTASELLKHGWLDRPEARKGIQSVVRQIFLTSKLESMM
eukprot:TRINITY_DN5802_c0_g1_i1.p1 TRINITY_DN5802_c0_g1~~TRINITY_DN5802_c0_g1_i1.p1  ORF type:complete len:608 (-),score=115.26 TRINITY_DN5802_c0_g1_i1:71-1894(-)